jgi:hypothetical protein
LRTYYMNNIYKALFEIMKLKKIKYSLWHEFELYCLHNKIEKIMYKDYLLKKEEDFHIENVLKYNVLTNDIIDLMQHTANETIQFWGEIKSKQNGVKLYENAVNIHKNVNLMKSFFTELVHSLKFRNRYFIKFFSVFLEKTIFHDSDSINFNKLYLKELIDHADIYDNDRNELVK